MAVLGLMLASGCATLPAQGESGDSLQPLPVYRQSRVEFLLLVKACIEDRGFSVVLRDDGGFDFGELGSRERLEAARAASRECIGEVDPARLEPPPPLTAAQLSAMYAYAVAQTECMRSAGYLVRDPPPKEVFIDTGGQWDPYVDLAQQDLPPLPEDVVRCQNIAEKPPFLDQ